MTLEQFHEIVDKVYLYFQKFIPKDTGNLRFNAFRFEYVAPNRVELYIDESIAPYMPYTNEPWISPRWKGKKNPNEYWFQNTVEKVVNYIVEQFNGKVEIVQ